MPAEAERGVAAAARARTPSAVVRTDARSGRFLPPGNVLLVVGRRDEDAGGGCRLRWSPRARSSADDDKDDSADGDDLDVLGFCEHPERGFKRFLVRGTRLDVAHCNYEALLQSHRCKRSARARRNGDTRRPAGASKGKRKDSLHSSFAPSLV